MTFSSILVANRGEIACRVMRTARQLGYRSVAVFSSADAGAPHVLQADAAVHIGAAPAADSYLNIEALLAAAKVAGADAVHPGVGFLSERADFAQACIDAGLVFIGPPPSAISAMGDKAGAKRRMLAAGVPCAPGYTGDAQSNDQSNDQSDEHLAAQAALLGLPLLVKAVAGGGGRGIRLVHTLADLPAALAGARREALSAFGNGALMLERLITDARHIEIQIFADSHGHVLHLGERDCTAQRRRQKVIEEAPSPCVNPALRAAMGTHAVAAARAVGYVGAGTVEFVVDAQLKHYFLEMNTRLQVEHPVTECITALDLVEWQLRVAAGEPLPLAQDEVRFTGHAIEARLYAEDPCDQFKPQTGRIAWWHPAAALHPGVRIDHGIQQGTEVTPFYDGLLAKVVAHGHTRADATRRLCAALQDAPLLGVTTNARFLLDLLRHPQFTQAQMTTTCIDEWATRGEPLLQRPAVPALAWLLAAALRGGANTLTMAFDMTLHCNGEARTLRLPLQDFTVHSWQDGVVRYSHGGVQRRSVCVDDGAALHLAFEGAAWVFTEPSPFPTQRHVPDARRALAPLAGMVVQVLVAPGSGVVAGQPLVCIEAMKMETWLSATAAGSVRAVHCQARQPVAAGALLVELELAP